MGRFWPAALLALAACLLYCGSVHAAALPSILVVGSLNVDIIVPVHRLPERGETITARDPSNSIAVGGKGANQAVAAARLGAAARFVGRFGNDSYATWLEQALKAEGVDVSGCGRASLPSGQGLVLLEADGHATSVVVGGANTDFPKASPAALGHLVKGAGALMLQREVPEHVNEAVAAAAAAAGVPVLLDVGGEDRLIAPSLLRLLDYVCPNESELARLTQLPTDTEEQVLLAAGSLRARGARNVLVTLGSRGALLLREDGAVLRQEALTPPGGVVADTTAAGDAFRAGFAVALVEGRPLQHCLRFAAAAGGLAVTRLGAVPSLPRRRETEQLAGFAGSGRPSSGTCGGGSAAECSAGGAPSEEGTQPAAGAGASAALPLPPLECPYQFASRLNSMRARRDLAGRQDGGDDVAGWIKRQSRIQGLSLVDFNHPQHTAVLKTPKKARALLESAGLAAGAICIRFPEKQFALGAFSHPEAAVRQQAVALAADGCRWAAELGARDLVVWPQFDGYDYNFQADYPAAWRRTVEAYRQLVDSCPPGVRVSLEYKPTDEATRWAIVPSTGAALLLAWEVVRPAFGLTLDLGHLLMAGENPAQGAALAGAAGKLFGLQLNDAHVKLGAEDGLAFASVNPTAALELMRWLQRSRPQGLHLYFDTFPRKEDPVREAEYNIRRVKALWARAARLAAAGIDRFADSHDALGALEMLEAEEGAAGAAGTGAAGAPAAATA
ncbi:hypothetical protein ABPG75_006120 [Micractinium tetrahymenae]